MNTPTHITLNLAILGKKENAGDIWAITSGALLPDVPIIGFYLFHKVFLGTAEFVIWSRAYFAAGWQIFFDIFSSFPLFVLGILLAIRFKFQKTALFLASMGIHGLSDFLLHNDDAHRHFFPLSDWRFHSPISYWDPAHFGQFIAPLEAIGVLITCFLVWQRFASKFVRKLISVIGLIYTVYWGYAVWMWT